MLDKPSLTLPAFLLSTKELHLLLLTAIELSLGGSSPYSSADKTNKNKCNGQE